MPRLFDKKIVPACAYCKRGRLTADQQMILCKRHGIVSPSDHCRRFCYDPLKRVPRVSPPLKQYDQKDFSL